VSPIRTISWAPLLLLISVSTAMAEARFAITSSAIDSGGNRSEFVSGKGEEPSRFTLTGTVGQLEAAPILANLRFAIQPGFWNEYHVIQQPGAPRLVIRHGAIGVVVLAWPVSVEGFILEQSYDLTPQSWTAVLIPVVDTATEHTVTVSITEPRMFFRLRHP
jgi:hypothetical protein